MYPTGRLMIKLYSECCSDSPHELQIRSPDACFTATVIVPPGCAVWMGDIARGSSVRARHTNLFEHRGKTPAASSDTEFDDVAATVSFPEASRTPHAASMRASESETQATAKPVAPRSKGHLSRHGAWTIELVLTCNIACFDTLEERLRACGAELAGLVDQDASGLTTGAKRRSNQMWELHEPPKDVQQRDEDDWTAFPRSQPDGEDDKRPCGTGAGRVARRALCRPRTLDQGAPLLADATQFVNHAMLCHGTEAARHLYTRNAIVRMHSNHPSISLVDATEGRALWASGFPHVQEAYRPASYQHKQVQHIVAAQGAHDKVPIAVAIPVPSCDDVRASTVSSQ